MLLIEILPDKCDFCGCCVGICPEDAIEMITQSIENGWTGLFDLNKKKVQQNNSKSQFEVDLEKTERAKKIALDLWNESNN